MAYKEVRELHFTCDGCECAQSLDKKDGENSYPGGWFRVILRGKTDAGRREFDMCPKCTGKLVDAIEEGELQGAAQDATTVLNSQKSSNPA